MNRRDFLLFGTGTLASILYNPTDLFSNPNISALEREISEMRGLAPENTPSKKLILNHYENLAKNFKPYYEKASLVFSTPIEFMKSISGIEQGKPYKGFNTGLALESPTGPKGIGQLSFAAFADSCFWNYKNFNKNPQKQANSALNVFNGLIDETKEEVKSMDKEIWSIVNSKKPKGKYSNSERSNYYGQVRYEMYKTKAQEKLKEQYNKIFDNEVHQIGNKEFYGPEVQLHTMSAYLRLLNKALLNWEFSIGTYNHGMLSTNNIISKYASTKDKAKPKQNIAQIIKDDDLSYKKVYSYKEVLNMIDYLKTHYKALKFLDKDYYLKVKIAQKEILLEEIKHGKIM